jgi:hypothetical protein
MLLFSIGMSEETQEMSNKLYQRIKDNICKYFKVNRIIDLIHIMSQISHNFNFS